MMKFAAQLPKTVDELNEVLRESQEPHDTYLALLGQANEQSVPLLLNRLVLDYGTSEPQNPYVGIICTHAHLVEVLKSITNTDQGLYYPRWAAWWDAHQTLSREKWVLDGFAAIGLHPVEPIDERFALEIIDLLGGRLDYHSYSARWLLASVSQAARERWLTLAASSGQRIRRLGVLEVLRSIDATGQEQLLRKLAADPDLEIRRRALTILNRRLRAMLSAGSARPQGFCRMVPDKYERFSASFAAGLLIVVNSEGVAALDTRTLRTVWGVPARSGVTTSLTDDQAIFLVTESGTLLAIDLNGKALWQRNHMDDAGAITRMLRQGDNLVVLREHMIEQLDAKTGATKLISQVTDTVKDADSSGRFAYFIDDHGLQPFDGGKELRLADLHGISVTSQRVCLTSGPIRSEGRVACLTANELAEQWSRQIEAGGAAPIQDGQRVFVPTDNDLTAFDVIDGSLLWTTEAGQETHDGRIVPTDYGLLLSNENYQLELRDPHTGESRRVWPRVHGISRISVYGHTVAVIDLDNILWLLDLSDS